MCVKRKFELRIRLIYTSNLASQVQLSCLSFNSSFAHAVRAICRKLYVPES